MVAFSKRKNLQHRLWRPDFRDVQTLPDTKVIRTGFLLNFIAIALALGFLTLYGVREYSLQGLMREVSALKVQVSGSTSQNRSILDVNKRFRQSALIMQEAIAFDWQPVTLHALTAAISSILEEGTLLSMIRIDYSEASPSKDALPPLVLELTGRVLETAPGTPSEVLSNFQTSIEGLPLLEGKKVNMEMANFGRNNEFGYFDFTLLVKIEVKKPPTL